MLERCGKPDFEGFGQSVPRNEIGVPVGTAKTLPGPVPSIERLHCVPVPH